jgi:hypothetical protein
VHRAPSLSNPPAGGRRRLSGQRHQSQKMLQMSYTERKAEWNCDISLLFPPVFSSSRQLSPARFFLLCVLPSERMQRPQLPVESGEVKGVPSAPCLHFRGFSRRTWVLLIRNPSLSLALAARAPRGAANSVFLRLSAESAAPSTENPHSPVVLPQMRSHRPRRVSMAGGRVLAAHVNHDFKQNRRPQRLVRVLPIVGKADSSVLFLRPPPDPHKSTQARSIPQIASPAAGPLILGPHFHFLF